MLRTALRSKNRAFPFATAYAASQLRRNDDSTSLENSCAENGDSKAIHLRRLFSSTASDSPTQDQCLRNSILMIPGVLSPHECTLLRNEANRLLDSGGYTRDVYCDGSDDDNNEGEEYEADSSLRRVSLCDMTVSAQILSEGIIKGRILPILRSRMPHLCRHLGFEAFDAPDAVFEWAADEPSVNRYIAGGTFEAHKDGYPLTVIILLSEKGSFIGGGTEFFESSSISCGGRDAEEEKSVLIQPPQGAAIIFDGDITHSGSPVVSGVRHLYVASFGLLGKELDEGCQ